MDECTQAVDKLITIVMSNPVLYHPNYNKPFILEVDVSQYAIGAILQQADDLGKLHPVGYFSKALTDVERGYNVHDRELLVLVKGLDHWQHLLLASGHQTTVYMDHKNLLYYQKPQDINRRVACYIPKLAKYDMKLVHKPGTTNWADALSRHPGYDDGSGDNKAVTVLPDHFFCCVISFLDIEEQVCIAQEGHESVSCWKETLPIQYSAEEG
jgi:RNase H-like domain found in reverse transcriptase